MQKRALVTNVEDRFLSIESSASRCGQKLTIKDVYAAPESIKRRYSASGVSSEHPGVDPSASSKLSIRGLAGGSLTLDLLNLDVEISESAFAQWISDEALKNIDVHHGDIVVVDPMRPLCHGAVVLIGLNGCEVFRRLKKQRRLWLLESLDGAYSSPIPLVNYPLYGVVSGFVQHVTGTKTSGNDERVAIFRSCLPKAKPGAGGRETSRKSIDFSTRGGVHYAKGKRSLLLLAAERSQSPYRLAEPERTRVYSVRAITR